MIRLKICHVTTVHSYNDTRIFLKEAKTLAKVGFDVHLIAKNVESKKLEGINIHGLESQKVGRLKRIIQSSNEVFDKALSIDADIYHFHDPELMPVGIKLMKRGKKVIYDVHEDLPRQILTKHWIPKFLKKPLSYAVEIYENRASKKFSAIVAATPHIRDRFLKINSNTIDVNNYPIVDELITIPYDRNQKKQTVCYVGGITKLRGIFETLEAISSIEGCSLNLAGNFSNTEEEEMAKNSPAWKKVNDFGFIGREEIKELYRTSSIGLVTLHPTLSYKDSLPIKMFEYMAAGLPIIYSNFDLWNSITENGSCGIAVDPLNIDEIKEAIQMLLKNPEKAEEMGSVGRRLILDRYNWNIESEKLISLYNSLGGKFK